MPAPGSDATLHYREAIRFVHKLGDDAQLTEPLQGLVAVAIATGNADFGVRLLGANAAIRERLGGGSPPEWIRLGDSLGDTRKVLTEEAYQRAWEAALAMRVDDIVSQALTD